MHRRSLILFIILLSFWVVIASSLDLQHILLGGFLSLITVLLWHDLGLRLPHRLPFGVIFQMGRCLILLIMYIIQSNLAVAKTLLFSGSRLHPVFVAIRPPLETDWGRVMLATCITITPGTVTIDLDPETGNFIVHALTEETAVGLFYWRIIDEIKAIEDYVLRRRSQDVINPCNSYDSNSLSASQSDYRANGN